LLIFSFLFLRFHWQLRDDRAMAFLILLNKIFDLSEMKTWLLSNLFPLFESCNTSFSLIDVRMSNKRPSEEKNLTKKSTSQSASSSSFFSATAFKMEKKYFSWERQQCCDQHIIIVFLSLLVFEECFWNVWSKQSLSEV
jgi:hypothetical protein